MTQYSGLHVLCVPHQHHSCLCCINNLKENSDFVGFLVLAQQFNFIGLLRRIWYPLATCLQLKGSTGVWLEMYFPYESKNFLGDRITKLLKNDGTVIKVSNF